MRRQKPLTSLFSTFAASAATHNASPPNGDPMHRSIPASFCAPPRPRPANPHPSARHSTGTVQMERVGIRQPVDFTATLPGKPLKLERFCPSHALRRTNQCPQASPAHHTHHTTPNPLAAGEQNPQSPTPVLFPQGNPMKPQPKLNYWVRFAKKTISRFSSPGGRGVQPGTSEPHCAKARSNPGSERSRPRRGMVSERRM